MWLAGISLESIILFRSFRSKMFSVYPLFYTYVVCVLGTEISRLVVYRFRPPLYTYWWWGTEFLSLLVGYLVIFDILEKGLAAWVGVKRFARIVGLIVLAGIVTFTTIELLARSHLKQELTSVEVERNLRFAELILLGGILLLVAYYGIPIGRNLKGIILGYGLYVGTMVMDGAARSYLGDSFHGVFSNVRSYAYLASLMVWTVALWSYYPNPVPSKPAGMGGDYEAMVTKTKNALGDVRSHLDKGGRQ
jgi:hypothetical protein